MGYISKKTLIIIRLKTGNGVKRCCINSILKFQSRFTIEMINRFFEILCNPHRYLV